MKLTFKTIIMNRLTIKWGLSFIKAKPFFYLYNLPLTNTISTPITFLILSTSELVSFSGLTTIK